MKFLALRWHIGAEEHCLVDTVNAANVEERHRFMVKAFPENEAFLTMIDVPDGDGSAKRLRPAPVFAHHQDININKCMPHARAGEPCFCFEEACGDPWQHSCSADDIVSLCLCVEFCRRCGAVRDAKDDPFSREAIAEVAQRAAMPTIDEGGKR